MLKNILAFSKVQTFLFIIYLVPVALLLGFVANFSVNVPFWDQWSLVSLLEKISTGKANFGDLFAQNNEHRILFPKLIIVALAFISKWNIRYELLFSILLAVVTFCALYRISFSQVEAKASSLAYLANILTCVFIFSLVQFENWLWGFQISWFLVNACVAIAILVLTSFNTCSTSIRLSLAAIFCFIASFSLAHGLLSWLALIPSVASLAGSPKQKARRTLLWILLFIVSFAIYSVGYVKPSHHPDIFFFLKHPLMSIKYFFSFLGSPLWLSPKFGFNIPIAIGLIIFSIFLFFSIYFIKNPKSSFSRKVVPWISLGLFAILFAFITTVGRVGFGVEWAFASRYTTTSVLLIISLVQMWCLFAYRNHRERSLSRKHLYNFPIQYKIVAVILTCLILINSIAATVKAHRAQLQRQYSKTCLELIHYFTEGASDNCLRNLYPFTSEVKKGGEILEKIGFRDFPSDIAFISESVKDYGYITLSHPTEKTLSIKSSGSVSATGWAILPDRSNFPKIVLLSHGSNRSFFTSAPVNLDIYDVAKAFIFNQYIKVKWAVKFSPKLLPVGETVIRAWVYDPYEKQFVKLIGEPIVKVVEQ